MSKWIDGDLFNKFVEQKKNEKEKPQGGYKKRSELAWKNPDKGTVDVAKVYVGRFLTDPKGQFYKNYLYHMFQTGENWTFFLCQKTYNFDNYCPFCSVTNKLYTGTKADKSLAYNFKRKEKFASNWFVIDDPRDAEAASEEEKVNGKVRVYEFPGKVEVKIKEQITDTKNGLGPLVFDPGKDGFNFILKVNATKKDQNNKVWPDYNLSEFSRKSHPIAATDKEISEIMKTTIDLDEYIENMEKDEEEVIATLKQHMLWDLVSAEWKKAKGIEKELKEDDVPTSFSSTAKEEPEVTKEEVPFDLDGEEELSDADLLKKLESL